MYFVENVYGLRICVFLLSLKVLKYIIEETLVKEFQEIKLKTGFKGVDCGWYRDAQLLYCVQLKRQTPGER